ncbi:MAG: DNA-3-methyladenine glycosylase 2 family protein [Euryarchaeota archaeon]|nr:DNA-3-methyladenine glycosylase 2 family protein [Euryarchaeota archaeon]
MILDLDHTLGCGQVFRWRKHGDEWKGVVDGRMVTLHQDGEGVSVSGMSDERFGRYFRRDDDLEALYRELGRDDRLRSYFQRYRGLRLVRQDPWECMASYVLATNANIPRIQGMIERVCRTFGTEMDGYHAFPTPGQLLDRCERAGGCGLGYRSGRFIELARMAYREEIDFSGLASMGYEECARELVRLPGIGPKVADCVSVFSLDHLEAFPVDVRIRKAMAEMYGMEGSYRKVSGLSRERFGRWAGYAQEYIYYAYGR